MLHHVRENYKQHYADKTDIKSNVLKLMKKGSNLILASDEDDLNMYLSELRFLFELMLTHIEIADLYQWSHLTTKFYEYLKSSKNKTNKLNVIYFKFNYFSNLIYFYFS